MTSRQVADGQIAAALRAELVLPSQADLRARILQGAEHVPQRRRLPWVFGRLTDADPLVRRPALLLAAMLLLTLALSIVAIAGALVRPRDPMQDLSLLPPANVDAFVMESYTGLAALPAMKVTIGFEGNDDIVYHDGAGTIRHEAAGTPPATTIYRGDRAATLMVGAEPPLWVIRDAGDRDPRWLFAMLLGADRPQCAASWAHIGVDVVLDRPAHHVRCVAASDGLALEHHLWIDVATGLPMRVGSPVVSPDASGVDRVERLNYTEVREIEIGPQPRGLFVADGLTMTEDEWECAQTRYCKAPLPTESTPTSAPIPSPRHADDQAGVPADLEVFMAGVSARYESIPAIDIVIDPSEDSRWTRWMTDGIGNYRLEVDVDAGDDTLPIVQLHTGGQSYESYPKPGGATRWRAWGPTEGQVARPDLGLPAGCGLGWEHIGVDVILDRVADHVRCGLLEFWIDREWGLVVRAEDRDPLRRGDSGIAQVLDVRFGAPPPELFEPPPPEAIIP